MAKLSQLGVFCKQNALEQRINAVGFNLDMINFYRRYIQNCLLWQTNMHQILLCGVIGRKILLSRSSSQFSNCRLWAVLLSSWQNETLGACSREDGVKHLVVCASKKLPATFFTLKMISMYFLTPKTQVKTPNSSLQDRCWWSYIGCKSAAAILDAILNYTCLPHIWNVYQSFLISCGSPTRIKSQILGTYDCTQDPHQPQN